jgi:predicted amidohydrolase YtcJ
LALIICVTSAYSQEATLLLYDGKVVTVDPQFRVTDSITIQGKRIIGVGTLKEIKKLAGPHTRQGCVRRRP